jgi:hypothetical protein
LLPARYLARLKVAVSLCADGVLPVAGWSWSVFPVDRWFAKQGDRLVSRVAGGLDFAVCGIA